MHLFLLEGQYVCSYVWADPHSLVVGCLAPLSTCRVDEKRWISSEERDAREDTSPQTQFQKSSNFLFSFFYVASMYSFSQWLSFIFFCISALSLTHTHTLSPLSSLSLSALSGSVHLPYHRMPCWEQKDANRSQSTLATRARPLSRRAASRRWGSSSWQCPHHGAKKSTSTTSLAKQREGKAMERTWVVIISLYFFCFCLSLFLSSFLTHSHTLSKKRYLDTLDYRVSLKNKEIERERK